MSVIAIDSSARRRLVVVRAGRAGELLDASVVEGPAAVPALWNSLAGLLDDDVEAVVVVTGPGSYTGLRTGMAAGLGVAHPRGLPLHGVGSLEVVATVGGGAGGLAVSDAGRGGVYAADFAGGRLVSPPRRMDLAALEPGSNLVSLDFLDVPGLRRGDPAHALASSVPLGLTRAPLAPSGLIATYLDDAVSAVEGPRV